MKTPFDNSLLRIALVGALSIFLARTGAAAEDAVTLKVVKVDSEETAGENGSATNAVDGNPETFWHTQWQDENPPTPHESILKLRRARSIAGFTYLPRQDESDHGIIKDYEFYVSEDGKDFGKPVKKGTLGEGREKKTVNFEAKSGQFVKLRALSEINGEAWTSAAEIGIVEEKPSSTAAPAAASKPASASGLKVVKVDSEETAGEDGRGANAVDGNPSTFWHTQWQDDSPPPPHEIIIELATPRRIKGFTYLPRQDEEVNGTIKDYEFYVSDDGKDFGKPVKKGSFDAGKEKKTVTFDSKKCHFIKLKALSEINGEAWTSAAEIGIVLNE
jgi:hypothetical protein